MRTHRLIVNPAAGGGAAQSALPAIEHELQRLGVVYDVVQTLQPLHGVALAKTAAAAVDVVVAVGGDGTSNEVINGLMQAQNEGHRAALGVLCVGRGNDFAFGMGVPEDAIEGCRVLSAGVLRSIDVGRVTGGDEPDGRFFGNGIGIGFDAVVGFVAARMKRLHGFLGYFLAAIMTMFVYYRAPQVRLEHDGQSVELRALMVSVMNGRRMGGGFMMAPDGQPDDGLLDLCIARQIGRARIFPLMMKFMKGTQRRHPAILDGRTARISVTALEGVLPAHADGETLCTDGQHLTIEVFPNALEMVTTAVDA
jgi:diacylglycerol kinase (ATP)